MTVRANVSFRVEGERLVLALPGRRGIAMHWRLSLEVLAALDRVLRRAESGTQTENAELVSLGDARFLVRQRLDRIYISAGNRFKQTDLFDVPWTGDSPSPCRQLYAAWLTATKRVEETSSEVRDQLIEDAAIAHRAGLPFGLVTNPLIAAEAAKEADGNRNLRRYMKDNRQALGPVTNGALVLAAPGARQLPAATPLQTIERLAPRLSPSSAQKLLKELPP